MNKPLPPRCIVLAALLLAPWGPAWPVQAAPAPPPAGSAESAGDRDPAEPAGDSRARAGFLARFGGFVQWPSQSFGNFDAPIVIGILEADGVADDLASLAPRHLPQGRSLAVRRLRLGEPIQGVHVLFIGPGVNGRLSEVLSFVRSSPVLTVTEHADALAAGSVVNFTVVDGRLRFEVSLKSAARAGLSISARLLSAASRVEPLP